MDNNILINDNLKKESTVLRNFSILFFALSILFPLGLIWNDIETIYFIIEEAFFLVVTIVFFWNFMVLYKYNLIVTKNRIILTTLIKKNLEIELKEVKSYTCKAFWKRGFYLFTLSLKDKNTSVVTRFKNELEEILKWNILNIENSKTDTSNTDVSSIEPTKINAENKAKQEQNCVILKDNMVFESNFWIVPMLLGFFVAFMGAIAISLMDGWDVETILTETFFLLLASFFLYKFLSFCKYNFTLTNEKIILNTISKKNMEIELKNIDGYSICTTK